MPVLENEKRNTTRSALRYRPINTDQAGPDPVTLRQRRTRSVTRSTAPATADEQPFDAEEQAQPARRSRALPPRRVAPVRPKRHLHPLFFVGAGLLAMILLWMGLMQVIAWGTNTYNTLIYGYPRTFQIDAVVGHNDSPRHPSHFIAVNLHGTINIIEFPGSDPSRARLLASSSSLEPGADQAVVTLRFVDLKHNGKPDMLVDIGGVQSVLVNDGSTFRVPTPAEQQQILLELQQTH
ncbi:MAG TPA: hypothetical protein VHD63_28965 [Ktedonobacteraceae bacterium]|nr:hypothetical protein [Ktedonobacteraceae bacterium]